MPADDVIPVIREVVAAYDPAGELPVCGISAVHLGPDVWSRVTDAVTGLLGGDPSEPVEVAVLGDTTRITRAGRDLKEDVEAALGQAFRVRPVRLDDGHSELHADEKVLERATELLRGVDAVVSVGGGTITDIGKVATHALADIPLVAIQTAASVDGFTDDVSVVLRNGVKRTIPSRWPDVVIADVETIGHAPPRMNIAGFGEINSMFTAPADWLLAALLGVDTSFHEMPIRLLERVAEGVEEWSAGLGVRPESTERLTRALAIRGIATGVSGSTACLSGVEHLISHMLDMNNGFHGRPIGLHGLQVGAGSVVAAAAWEELFDRLDSDPGVASRLPDRVATAERDQVEAAFAELDPTGRVGGECWADYAKKAAALQAHRADLVALLAEWPAHRARLGELLRSSRSIATGLVGAGATARLSELHSVVDADMAVWAVSNSAFMRNRVTVLDLFVALGWWEAADVRAVLARAEQAVQDAEAAR